MRLRNLKTSVAVVVATLATAVGLVAWAAGPVAPKPGPNEIQQGTVKTLEGRLVDLNRFMSSRYASADHAKCTAKCIRAGVPCAIETKDGLVVIGEGMKSPSSRLAPLAFDNVKITGKYYDRDGVKYVDMEKIEKAAQTNSSSAGSRKSGTTGKPSPRNQRAPSNSNKP